MMNIYMEHLFEQEFALIAKRFHILYFAAGETTTFTDCDLGNDLVIINK